MRHLINFVMAQLISISLYIAAMIGNLPHRPNDYDVSMSGWQYTILAVKTVLQQMAQFNP